MELITLTARVFQEHVAVSTINKRPWYRLGGDGLGVISYLKEPVNVQHCFSFQSDVFSHVTKLS